MKPAVAAFLALSSLLVTTPAMTQAQPAVYRDGLLELPQGIVVSEGNDQYFSDIRLHTEANGSLRIVSAQQRRLITLQELELNQLYGDEPQVELQIAGYKSMPCVALAPVSVRRIDNVFHVLIAEGDTDPLALCAQVLTPVDVTVELDVRDLPAGDYVALINNEPMEFTLEDFAD